MINFTVINAFVSGGAGGNGAGVVIEDELTPEAVTALAVRGRRCAVASRIGLSETAFVQLPNDPHEPYSIRYFTPTEEVPLCGHATVAAVAHLRERGHLPYDAAGIQISTGAGLLRVALEREGGGVFLTQSPPDFSRPPIALADVAASLGLDDPDTLQDSVDSIIVSTPPATPVSTGLFDACVRIRSVEALRKLNPDWKTMAAVSSRYELCGFHAYAMLESAADHAAFPGADIFVRNFAPAVGINEESATGTANGALCSLLWRSGVVVTGRTTLVVAQGDFMTPPAPSRITVRVTEGVPGKVAPTVGGAAAFVREGRLDIRTVCVD